MSPISARENPDSPFRQRQREIALAGIAIADEKGIEAVSMRNIAERLAVGTMTLYSYIQGKDDLRALMADQLTSEFLIPEPMPTDWREALTEIATRTHDTITRHPWMFSSAPQDIAIRPNILRHVDQSMRAVSSLDVTPSERGLILMLIDDFAIGRAIRAQRMRRNADGSSNVGRNSVSERLQAVKTDEVRQMFDDGELTELSRVFGHDHEVALARITAGPPPVEDGFERGLEILLDGIEAQLAN